MAIEMINIIIGNIRMHKKRDPSIDRSLSSFYHG